MSSPSSDSRRDYVAIAAEYGRAVLSGGIPACLQVRRMCERQERDLRRQGRPDFPFVWRPEAGARVCAFVEKLPHVKGRWARQPFVLAPWQVFFTLALFSWQHRETGLRRFREVFLLVPRKNGKTQWAAALGLYGLLADHEAGAEIYCGANSRDQAMYVFRAAQQMLLFSPRLCRALGAEVHASKLVASRTGGRFEPEIRNVRDGASPHFAITDELHEADSPHMVDAFSTGMGARAQPLLIIISTAGVNLAGPCRERQIALEQVLNGTVENDRLFGTVYTIDKEDDWRDLSSWVKANPNYGVSISHEFIESKIFETQAHVSRRNINLCKHLNVWNATGSAFFDMRLWEKCLHKGLHIEDFAGEPCWLGLDLSSKIDVAALIILFREGQNYVVFGRFYLPEDTINRPENAHYQGWAHAGRLIATEGAVIDYSRIEEEIRALASAHEVRAVAYDPFQATQLSTRLTAEGFPMIEVRPTFLNFSEPMKELESLVLQGRLRHDGDPVLTWMASNVTVKTDAKDNIYPVREAVRNKIDGIVALIMALNRAMAAPEPERSVYETRGVMVL